MEMWLTQCEYYVKVGFDENYTKEILLIYICVFIDLVNLQM